jgi:hypothetical protein
MSAILKLIPEPYRIAAAGILAAILLASAFTAGAVVNGWRLDGAHQRALAAKDETIGEKVKLIGELETAISNQNHAVALMQAQAASADERRRVAEQFASGTINRLGSLEEMIAGSKATSCDGVLREAWGAWK